MATFGTVSAPPSARHALRRFYENNAKALTTVPKSALTVVDFTEHGAAEAASRSVMSSCLHVPGTRSARRGRNWNIAGCA